MPELSDTLIFIDSNIYLSCYQPWQNKYRQLLEGLAPLAYIIHFTGTVDAEFRRNRVSAYIEANKVPVDNIKIPVFAPHHQVEGEDTDEKNIRKKDELENKRRALYESISNYHLKNIRSILDGNDDVSRAITPLKSFMLTASGAELKRARLRKELGNPPGKKNDPLGDQISWEQLLSRISGKRSVWIVTNDSDFFERTEKEIFLNPFLQDELREQSRNIEIYCFDNLADFFSGFNKSGLAPSTTPQISPERIAEAKVEYQANTNLAALSSFRVFSRTTLSITCPNSTDGRHSFDIAVVANPSLPQGVSYIKTCRACGFQVETPNAVDD